VYNYIGLKPDWT